MSKAAIYCRLSEEDRNKQVETDDSSSIQNQKSMLLQYAARHHWDVYDIYSDDDYTGADRNRPQFQRLLRDAKGRKFDIILCKTQSRFTRELELVETYIHGLFPLWGIRFISIVDNGDTANKGNKKSRQINGLVNEWYLEDMSENIRSVLNNRRENGYHIGSFALYGYQKDPNQKGHLIVDEEAAQVVREVFLRFSQGYGKTAIARMLNDRGIPNPAEYKRLHGLRYQPAQGKTGTLWKYSAISSMLTNEMYLGTMVQGKYGSLSYKTKQNAPRPRDQWYRVEGTHAPIIERPLWDQVQSLIAQRSKPFAGGSIGLFAHKVRCMNCGYHLRSSKNRGKYYLQCSSRHVSKDACVGSFIAVETLESIVVHELNRLSDQYLDWDAVRQRCPIQDPLSKEQEQLHIRLATHGRRQETYRRGLRALYVDRAEGLLSDQDFEALRQDFSAERDRLEQQIRRDQIRCSELEQQIEAHSRCDPLECYVRLSHLTRKMVDSFIDYILVGKRKPGEEHPPVEIHWNF